MSRRARREGLPAGERRARLFATAQRLTVPVPAPVLLEAVPEARAADLRALVADGALLADERGLHAANPLRAGPPARRLAGPRAALRLARALERWLGGEPFARDAELVEAARLALLAGDEARARAWLERLAHPAVVSGTSPAAAAALLGCGLVGEFLRIARAPTLLLLVDGGRTSEVRGVLRPGRADAWLFALLAVREERPADAFELVEPTSRRECIVLARAAIDLFEPERALELLAPHRDGAGDEAVGELAQVLELAARAERLTGRLDAATRTLDRLAELAERLGDGRLLPAVHAGRANHAFLLGRMGEADQHLARLHEALARLPPSRYRARADLVEAAIALHRGSHAAAAALIRGALGAERTEFRSYWARFDAEERSYRSDWDGVAARLAAFERSSPTTASIRLDVAMRTGDLEEIRAALADPMSEASDAAPFRRHASWLLGEPSPVETVAPISALIRVRARLFEAERELARDDLAAASDSARRALAAMEAHDIGLFAAEAWLVLADAAARAGALDEALRCLERAADRLAHPDAPAARMLAAARHALSGTTPPAADLDAWARARDYRALAVAAGAREDALPPGARAFFDAVPASLRAIAGRAFPASPPASALLVAEDARWFRMGAAAPVDLRRRRAVRLLFLRLLQEREEAPGRSVSMDEMLAAGWPGERLLPEAGWNRVYVALHTLRRLGLEDKVVTRDDGWLFDPEVPVLRVG